MKKKNNKVPWTGKLEANLIYVLELLLKSIDDNDDDDNIKTDATIPLRCSLINIESWWHSLEWTWLEPEEHQRIKT